VQIAAKSGILTDFRLFARSPAVLILHLLAKQHCLAPSSK